MGKIFETKIDRFDKGIADDNRTTDFRFCSMVKHFDTTYPHKLIPYRSTEANETKSLDIIKFIYAPGTTATTFKLYGLGKASGSTAAGIYSYDIDAGAPDSTSWTTPANNEGVTLPKEERVFFHYKNYLYNWAGSAGSTKLQRFGDLTSSPTFTDSYQDISYTDVAQPVHHRADDVAYFFHDNIVATLSNTTFVDNVLTLPTNLVIVSATEYGNYLAIGCRPKTPSSNLFSFADASVVYLWDRDSSLSTLSQRIDLGTGRLMYLAELDGQLIAVIDYFINNLYGLEDSKVIIKKIIGNDAFTVRNLKTDSTSSTFYQGVGKANGTVVHDRLYFPLSLINDGDTNSGIYCVSSSGNLTVEYVEEDVSTTYEGIYKTGGTWWIAHSNDGSVNRTDDDSTFTYTSVYESLKINTGDSGRTKKLIGVTVMTEALPIAGQVVLKYRKDEETSFTPIFTNTTVNSISHSATNIESTGVTLPQYKEIQFRIESTGGAVITGLKFKEEEIGLDTY